MRLREFAPNNDPDRKKPGVFVLDPNPATRQSQIIQIINLNNNQEFMQLWNQTDKSHQELFKNIYPIWDQSDPLFATLPIVRMTWSGYWAAVNGFIIRSDFSKKNPSLRLRGFKESKFKNK